MLPWYHLYWAGPSKGRTMRPKPLFTFLVITAALLGSVSVASATTITSPTGEVTTPTLEAKSEGHVAIDVGGGLPKIECASEFGGKVELHGEKVAATTVLSTLHFTGC